MTVNPNLKDVVEMLEDKLFDLAYQYRTDGDPQAVQSYQSILRCMIELGFTRLLDVDSELPDRLMPHEYLQLHRPQALGKLVKATER